MAAHPASPILICYDGSDDARHAIESAAGLFGDRHALIVTVWQQTAALGSFKWSMGAAGMVDFVELDRAAAEDSSRVAHDGARIAKAAGLEAEPLAVEANGPVWRTIIETADRKDAAVIVMGSRGLTGVRSVLLGSVSSAVAHHAHRPTLIVHRPSEDGGEAR